MAHDDEYIVQKALQDATALHHPPETFYEASPGQLLDHVNHRVARVVVRALRDAGRLSED